MSHSPELFASAEAFYDEKTPIKNSGWLSGRAIVTAVTGASSLGANGTKLAFCRGKAER
jgi:hypothetical protein